LFVFKQQYRVGQEKAVIARQNEELNPQFVCALHQADCRYKGKTDSTKKGQKWTIKIKKADIVISIFRNP